MNFEKKANLKLMGKNLEDLKVISAYLQDSIVIIRDVVFLKENQTFIMIVNRFMWEDVEKGVFRHNKRIRCALRFEEVMKVKSKNINQKKKKKLLEFLAIETKSINDKAYEIRIFFAGDGVITVISEVISMAMLDIGKPWNVKHIPRHKI